MSAAYSLTTSDLAAVARTIGDSGTTVNGELSAQRLTGGRSNLTYVLADGVQRWVLRTPPRAGRTPSAHDVAREHRVTAALSVVGVPVARPVVLCEDESVIGCPFTVSEYISGTTIQTQADLNRVDDATLCQIVGRLLETLAALHEVDP